ncbi:MAG: iron-containing redox enzyme family protein [Chloroflexi bacterium]|nr:iron-containing redox enzyme family protein [Chloroflexota bacterium]MDA1175001.1 iron-containing redox enzyme family protein [Chloroflexota bacterium]
MATATAGETFVDQVLKEIILPARDQLLGNRYFTDLRAGKLSKRRMQGFSLEHTWFNWVLLKGTALRMLAAQNVGQLRGNLFQISEEKDHPDMCKKFGLALGLTDEDFDNHIPTFQTLQHTSVIVASPITVGNAAAGRASGMVNETLVQRYSAEFAEYLTKAPYNMTEDEIEFFIAHGVVDVEHSKMAAAAVARTALTDRDQELVWYTAKLQTSLKLAKFDAIYDQYV